MSPIIPTLLPVMAERGDIPALYAEIIGLVRSSRGELNFNDALIALSCRYRSIPFLTSFDRDFDQVSWLKRVAQPGDLP